MRSVSPSTAGMRWIGIIEGEEDWSLTVTMSAPSRKLGLSPAKIHSIDKIKAALTSSRGRIATRRSILTAFQSLELLRGSLKNGIRSV